MISVGRVEQDHVFFESSNVPFSTGATENGTADATFYNHILTVEGDHGPEIVRVYVGYDAPDQRWFTAFSKAGDYSTTIEAHTLKNISLIEVDNQADLDAESEGPMLAVVGTAFTATGMRTAAGSASTGSQALNAGDVLIRSKRGWFRLLEAEPEPLFPANLDLEAGSEDVYFQVMVTEGGNRYDVALTFPAWLDPQRQLPPGSTIPPNNSTGSVRVHIPGWGSVSYYSATYYQAALRGRFLFTPQANVARDFAPTLMPVSDSRDLSLIHISEPTRLR